MFKIIKGTIGILCILFILCSPYYFNEYKENIKDYQEDTGSRYVCVITIWDYPRVKLSGDGTKYGFLRDAITKFEKNNKGIFIQFIPMEKSHIEREFDVCSKIGELPDIVPFDEAEGSGYKVLCIDDDKKQEYAANFVEILIEKMEEIEKTEHEEKGIKQD